MLLRVSNLLSFILAIAFAAGAVFMANLWLQSRPTTQVGQTALPKIETATIVVAAKPFSFGETLQREKLREIPWSKSDLPEGSFGKISEILDGGRRVALTSIGSNEAILKWKVSGAGGRASLSAAVTAGMRAVAVKVNDVVGVGGFVLPGDRVDLLYTRIASANSDVSSSTDVIVQNVRVLAIDQTADEKLEVAQVSKVVTVEVSTVDAQKVALAQTTGSITLSLRAAGSVDQAVAQRIVVEELVSSPSVYMAELLARDASQVQLEKTMGARLADIESRLKGEIADAGSDSKELRKKFAALEAAVKSSNGQSDDELRRRLAEFEASLQDGAPEGSPDDEVAVVEKSTVTIGVTRALKRDSYEVPEDGSAGQ